MAAHATSYRERWFTSQDGLSLYYRDYGDRLIAAVPLLCLGGLTRNSKDFHVFAERHAVGRRVLCPDYRGRGQSAYDPDWRNYVGPTYLNDTRHLLAAAGTHRVVVVGTSMGGLLAMGMGLFMPTQLAAVVLNDTGPELDPSGMRRILDYIATDRPQPDWEAAIRHLKDHFPTLALRDEAAWRAFAEGTFREGEDGLLHFDWDIAIIRSILDPPEPLPPLWPVFRSLRNVPVLVLRGGRSDVLSAETLERMKAEHPRLRTAIVPDVGHTPSLLEPEAETALEALLEDV